ncbi:Swt1 family HEPN domain-containing protein [Burkholderia pyrrocinia]|uniref:Swt1 family HEPN domain-containing protein n=1 Tax=Burkholderia pyrrocinia TaxID=60550 RepID=UPI00126034A0|nr:Swt1 family HEPN domain-containing protein [Burkholderia pyrrocinia]
MRQFVFNALLAENSLAQLASEGIAIRGTATPPVIAVEEFGFSPRIVYDAKKMSSVFTAFFCIENSARDLIAERLLSRKGLDWWNCAVPAKIRAAVEKLKEREAANKYHAARSTALIGYTLFGNLGQIIIANWDDFSDLFPDQAWVMSRFNDLEMSRNIIMHTGTLPQIEVDRVESILRDWNRQVG